MLHERFLASTGWRGELNLLVRYFYFRDLLDGGASGTMAPPLFQILLCNLVPSAEKGSFKNALLIHHTTTFSKPSRFLVWVYKKCCKIPTSAFSNFFSNFN